MDLHWFTSPAKINLFLHINGRLANGYHALQTYFQLLDFGDDIGIKVSEQNKLSLHDGIAGLADEDNLIIKAATALLPYRQHTHGAEFFVKKRLPMGGGIGGGSSNAATVLLALNQLWNLNLSLPTLMKLGLQLGADVPVFVNGYSGFAEGLGEQIYPQALQSKWVLVANPGIHVSTADIFNAEDLPRDTAKVSPETWSFENTRNDCETLVCKLHPKVANLLQWLVNYAPSRMTGTGASVFSLFDNEQEAKATLDALPKACSGFICQTTARSVLHEQLEQTKNAI